MKSQAALEGRAIPDGFYLVADSERPEPAFQRALIDRPKQGFAIPLERWLRGGLRPLLDRYLAPGHIAGQGLFDPPTVHALRQRFDAGDMLSTQPLWLLLAFQMWHERWMETSPVSSGDRVA